MTAGQVVSESRPRSWKKVITVTRRRQSRPEIIPFFSHGAQIVLCHIVFFAYAIRKTNKPDLDMQTICGRKRRERKHAATGSASRRVTLSSWMVSRRVWRFLREGREKVSQRRAPLSKMNRWQSLSVQICFISAARVVAQWMWAPAFFLF